MDFAALFDHFFQLTITGLALGAVYGLVALGYTLVYGVLQLINFAHSEVFMFRDLFAVAWVVVAHPWHRVHHPGPRGHALGILGIAFAAAMLTSAAIALLVERLAYRPLMKRGAPKLIILISAIGMSFSLAEIMGVRDKIAGWFNADHVLADYVQSARNVYSSPITINPRGLVPDRELPGDRRRPARSSGRRVAMMVVLDTFVRRTRLGRGIRAVAQDPESAALMGVNSTRIVQATFLIGGVMAGAAATLYMIRIGITRQDAGFLLGVKAFTAAVLGGIGNLRGALLGGLVLGVAQNWGAAVFGTQWQDVVAFVLLILILLVRPTGILGESIAKARV